MADRNPLPPLCVVCGQPRETEWCMFTRDGEHRPLASPEVTDG